MVRATPRLPSSADVRIYKSERRFSPFKIRNSSWLIAAAITVTGLWQPPVLAQEVPKLTLGVVIPLSGPLAPFGKEARSGVEVAIETIRQSDPQTAEKLTVIFEDNESVPSKATLAAQKLLQKDFAHVLIGGVTATATTAIATIASEAGRPLIAPISAPTGAIGTSPWVFSMALDDRAQGSAAALHALQNQVRTAVAFPDKNSMAIAFTKGFEETFTAAGGTMLPPPSPEPKEDDKIWDSLVALGSQAILLPLSGERVGRILKRAADRQSTLMILGGESWESRASMNAMGGAAPAQALHVSSFAAQAPDAATTDFQNRFRAKFNRRPGNIAAHFHDAVLVAWGGFRRARMNLPGPLAKGLRDQAQVAGACGNWKLVAGQTALRTAWMMRPDASEPKLVGRVQTQPPQIQARPPSPTPLPPSPAPGGKI